MTATRLVATDLDGTVVRTDGTLSARTVAALQAVAAAGIGVVFVTGRPTRWMAEIAGRTGNTGVAICANGAIVYDLAAEQVLERFELTPDVLVRATDLLRAALPDAMFAVECVGSMARESDYPVRAGIVAARVAPLAELVARPAVKLLVRRPVGGADELLAAARAALGDLVEVTHSAGLGPALVEISAAGVSKATTLARYCAERSIPAAAVIAFGDMPNDLPMLGWAGTSYAVANAHPLVLAAADRRTASNDDDGVALVLEQLLPPLTP